MTTSAGVSEISRVKTYESLDALAADADLVITGRVSRETTSEALNGLTFSVSVVEVTGAISGYAAVGDRVRLRELQETGGAVDGSDQLRGGREYLLYLDNFYVDPERPTDQYVVVGVQAGAFVENGGLFDKTSDRDEKLPKRVRVDKERKQVTPA